LTGTKEHTQTTLLKPKAIQVEALGGHRAKATLEPFERGYGHTLGNPLRRVLLSSMVGYAPTEVTIAGVLHKYSAIDGVQEDVVHIMLNFKGVVFRLQSRDEVTLVLRKEGEGAVTAADIQTPHDVEKSSTLSTSSPTCRKVASWTCRSRSRRAAATYRATCADMATSPRIASAESCSMPRSRLCVASATLLKTHVSSSGPTSTSW